MQKAADGLTKRKPVPPVAFRELIEFLPAKAAAMKRHEPKGETTKVGSWQYSQAEVREHQDRRLFGIRGVEPEGLERSRRVCWATASS